MLRLAFVVVSFVAFVGCNQHNPASCELPENAGKNGCPEAPPSECMGPADCTGMMATPVCAMMSSPHICVPCTDQDIGACAETTRLCKNNQCATCTLDSECGSGGLCLPTGTCATAANIVHAASTAAAKDVVGCGIPGGPGACTLERALTEVTATKNVIKLDDKGPYVPATANFVVNANITIDARAPVMGGAVLNKKVDGPLLSINDNKIVTILGGTITGAHGATGDAILCKSNAKLTIDGTTIQVNEESAINALAGCNLTVTNANINNSSQKGGQFVPGILTAGASITLSRSTLFSNKGGAINVTNGTFVIVGNSFSANGDPMSPVGGVLINTTTPDPMNLNRIEFNTISSNASMSSKVPGVDCTAGTGPIARNNIIWANDNTNATSPSTVQQVGGTCKHAYSDIGMLAVGTANDGGNNLSMDPMFQTAITDLHLLSTSPAIMRADPNAKLDGVAAKDFDGDLRIAPADIGFDQRRRQ